ncbi:uncharacterized protein DEA37_0010455 [Paragonimus westermani]|uniref:LIM zinc-binding domain-containing protein n=1 Tax=Paragonimus westermani TaxID=34504 RepID=A0A5J4NYS1_9TREM|nr:uncharacterized protein DEA37_0010455 [Paragonimus westermani]
MGSKLNYYRYMHSIQPNMESSVNRTFTKSNNAPVGSWQRSLTKSAEDLSRSTLNSGRSQSREWVSPAPPVNEPYDNSSITRGRSRTRQGASPTALVNVSTQTMNSSVRSYESSAQFCFICGHPVNPYKCIMLTDRVYHPNCAKCQTCQIPLGLSTYRDFESTLYCLPHYAQAVAESKERFRRSSSVQASVRRRSIGFTGSPTPSQTSTLSRTPSLRRSQNAWSVYDMQLDSLKSKLQNMDHSSHQLSFDNVTLIPTVASAPPLKVTPPQTPTLTNIQTLRGLLENRHTRTDHKFVYDWSQLKPFVDFSSGTSEQVVRAVFRLPTGSSSNNLFASGRLPLSFRVSEVRKMRSTSGLSLSALLPVHDYVQPVETNTPAPKRSISVDKNVCFECGKKVYATEMLCAMERVYHKGCFRCQQCFGRLGVENYHVLDGHPYCRAHFRQLLYGKIVEADVVQPPNAFASLSAMPNSDEANRCQACNQPVHPRDGMQILQQYYHYNCFRCTHCGAPLNMGKFEMAHGEPYCPEDFLQIFGRKRGSSSRQSLMHLNELVRSRSLERQQSYSSNYGQR